jgi:transcriptional regulator with XRE-family HTH domain
MSELKEILNSVGINQSDLASLLRVSKTMVSNWANNKKPIPKDRKVQISELVNSGKINDYLDNKYGKFTITFEVKGMNGLDVKIGKNRKTGEFEFID